MLKPLRKPLETNAELCLGMFGCNFSGQANVRPGANMSKSATATHETMVRYIYIYISHKTGLYFYVPSLPLHQNKDAKVFRTPNDLMNPI